jgi:hypothetical protein
MGNIDFTLVIPLDKSRGASYEHVLSKPSMQSPVKIIKTRNGHECSSLLISHFGDIALMKRSHNTIFSTVHTMLRYKRNNTV